MKHITPTLLFALLLVAPIAAQQHSHTLPQIPGAGKTYDYSNLTPEEIAEIKQLRHEFYAAERAGVQDRIKEQFLQEAALMNWNQADYDVRYYGINISLDFGSSSIDGFVDYQIRANVNGFNTVDLDLASNMTVTSVVVDGAPAAYSHGSDILSITTPTTYAENEEFEMSVYYNGTPSYSYQQGMGFGYVWGYEMCWTNCEPFGARKWFPCKDVTDDKPDSIDFYIERPSNYEVASVGAIVDDVDVGGGRKRVHYKHNYPITTYLIALSCADFDVHVQTWNYETTSMPVYSFALPNASGSYYAYQTIMPDVLTRLSDAWGLYPFATEKAGNANYGWGGAMEHQTCSFYSPGFYTDWVIAHETGHQWWGDMITCCPLNHMWLNEGGASYTEPIYFESRDGQAAYFNYMQTQKYLGGGTVYVEDIYNDDLFDQNLVYDKASWVWHMLRGVLGDSTFFQFIDDYYHSPFQYACASTADFTWVLSSTVGENMTWYTDQWIYGEGSPNYEISWLCEQNLSKGGFDFTYFIEQVQTGGTYFKMPIKTTFETTGASLDTVIWNEGAGQAYLFWFADSVTNIIFDPQEWILRQLGVVPFTMHISTLTLPDGTNGVAYAETLNVVGGTPPYHWQFVGGDLPYGLAFDTATAVISGTPNWAATFYFTIKVTDTGTPEFTDARGYALTVNEPGAIYGDADGNGVINVGDVVYLIDYIFNGGPAPDPLWTGDCDCNGLVNIADVVYLINYVFGGGPPPGCP